MVQDRVAKDISLLSVVAWWAILQVHKKWLKPKLARNKIVWVLDIGCVCLVAFTFPLIRNYERNYKLGHRGYAK